MGNESSSAVVVTHSNKRSATRNGVTSHHAKKPSSSHHGPHVTTVGVKPDGGGGGGAPTVGTARRSERVFSCPDEKQHSETELVNRLVDTFFAQAADEKPVPSADLRFRRFDGRKVPKIALRDYVSRISYYLSNIAESEKSRDPGVHSDLAMRYLLSSVIYIDRLRTRGLVVTPLNIHRLLITGVLVACKSLDDLQPGITYFADLGGLSPKDMSELEVAFVSLLEWKITIETSAFLHYYAQLLGTGSARDVFSTDLLLDYHHTQSPKKVHQDVPAE